MKLDLTLGGEIKPAVVNKVKEESKSEIMSEPVHKETDNIFGHNHVPSEALDVSPRFRVEKQSNEVV